MPLGKTARVSLCKVTNSVNENAQNESESVLYFSLVLLLSPFGV